jgi:hypothetical protein
VGAAVAGFLAHEPAAVLLGSRGVRARREQGRRATVWLVCCGLLGVASVAGALSTMPDNVRAALALPAIPAAIVAWLTARRREKSWYGEIAAGCAFALAAAPMSMAGGVNLRTALSVSLPFAALFAASTLAVRAVIARVRGGGDPTVATAARHAALGVTVISVAALAVITWSGWVVPTTLIAGTPGLVVAAIFAMRPPPPAKLRTVGWTLVATSIATAAIVIAGH